MNCKPGDLAIVVGGERHFEGALGKVVRVLSIRPEPDPGPVWLLETPFEARMVGHRLSRSGVLVFPGELVSVACMPDQWLRPVSGIPESEGIQTSVPVSV